ncbi:uncharacterized protein UBRO_20677 [Ustilago bromivora]|uniref:CCHC-type domain-containing protein n=1 Tax=Ustilago bromivora TaxID=307758 RepID=A0A1K0HEI3_9BASI|nr:uncharacterized protein UBRO_20677 [Ustilago bromivora]
MTIFNENDCNSAIPLFSLLCAFCAFTHIQDLLRRPSDKYFSERGDRPIEIAVDLFDWAIEKCTVHSDSKEYELLKAMYTLKWDQVRSCTYDFLTKWESHVSKLHAYMTEPWTPAHQYKTLKRTLPSDKNALFKSIFVLYKTLIKEHTNSSVANVLCKSYKLAADSAPVCFTNTIDDIDLSALCTTTLINCWACGDDGHPANRCPNESAYNKLSAVMCLKPKVYWKPRF